MNTTLPMIVISVTWANLQLSRPKKLENRFAVITTGLLTIELSSNKARKLSIGVESL